MIAATLKDELKAAYRQTLIIGIGMVAALFLYAYIVEMLQRESGQPIGFGQYFDVLRYVVFALSMASFFLIRFYRNFFLEREVNLRLNMVPYRGFSAIPQRLLFVSITTLAICESVAIYGLFLFFVGRSSQDFYILLAFSFILFGIYFPRFSEWEEWTRKFGG